jgi:hypothetical protein
LVLVERALMPSRMAPFVQIEQPDCGALGRTTYIVIA